MSANCPTCGQPIKFARGDRSAELRRLLSVPVRGAAGNHRTGVRCVYRAASGDGWHLTNAREIPPYVPFQRSDLLPLIASGHLVSTYPGAAGEHDCYELSAAARAAANRVSS